MSVIGISEKSLTFQFSGLVLLVLLFQHAAFQVKD